MIVNGVGEIPDDGTACRVQKEFKVRISGTRFLELVTLEHVFKHAGAYLADCIVEITEVKEDAADERRD